jgi:hypothetical protein
MGASEVNHPLPLRVNRPRQAALRLSIPLEIERGRYNPWMRPLPKSADGMTFLQKALLGCFGLLFLIIVAGLAVSFVLASRAEPGNVTFKVDRFCDFSAYHEAFQTPYVEGKLLLVHARSKSPETDLAAHFPPERLAAAEEEVGTIVWLEWSYEKVGDYVDTVTREKVDDAYKGTAIVSIVNQRTREILVRNAFDGFAPPN